MRSDIQEYFRLCLGGDKISALDKVARFAYPTEDTFEASKVHIIDALAWGTFHDLLPLEYSIQEWNALISLPANEQPQEEEFVDLVKKFKKCGVNAKRKFKLLKKTHYPAPLPAPLPAPIPAPLPVTAPEQTTNKRPREDDIESLYVERITIDLLQSVTEEEKKAIDELVRLLAFAGDITKVLEEYKKNREVSQQNSEIHDSSTSDLH